MTFSPEEAQGYLDTHPVDQRAYELAVARYLAQIRAQLEQAHRDELRFKAELEDGTASWPWQVGRLEGHLRAVRTWVELLEKALEGAGS